MVMQHDTIQMFYYMRFFSLLIVLIGAGILSAAIIKYRTILRFIRSQSYEQKVYDNSLYAVSLCMMFFFLAGYLATAVVFMTEPNFTLESLLTAIIFFFGSIFVIVMVFVQGKMLATITDKTLETLMTLIDTIEAKDKYTKGHSEHVKNVTTVFYDNMPNQLKSSINRQKLLDAAMLHDIGKIGIPDNILNKPGPLTEAEREVINQHPKFGKVILERSSYREISNWVLYHHERVDGSGYYKLRDKEIPIESKIISIADIFSAVSTDRAYHKKFSFEESLDLINKIAGSQLDTELVKIFCSINKEALLTALFSI